MNFERLLKKNLHKINNVTIVKKITNHFKLKMVNREKLKLGAITFEIKQIKIGDFKISETIDIRFIRQDNTFEDSLKIDSRIEALKWKSNFINIFALVFLSIIVLFMLYISCYNWYLENFHFLFNDSNSTVSLKQSSIRLIFSNQLNTESIFSLNSSLNSLLIDFFNYYFYNN